MVLAALSVFDLKRDTIKHKNESNKAFYVYYTEKWSRLWRY